MSRVSRSARSIAALAFTATRSATRWRWRRRRSMGLGRRERRSWTRSSGGSRNCSPTSRRCRACASARSSRSSGMRAARRSSTTCCASCGRGFCRRRAATSAPAIALGNWRSSICASRVARSRSGGARRAAATSFTCELPYSRAFAGTLVFSKEFCDIAFGMGRCLGRLGALPAKLVWDREGAIAPQGRPTEQFLAFCGQLALGWVILDAGDCQAKGALERSHRFLHGNFEAGRRFANPLDFQHQLDGWCDRINGRVHRTTRAVVAERLAEERALMRPLPAAMPDSERRFVTRVPAQPYLRVDRNDYSLDPRLVGRRVEVRVTQREVIAVALDTGELAARHARVFAGGLCFTDRAHQRALDELRGERRRRRREPEVELRSLAHYDRLIPA